MVDNIFKQLAQPFPPEDIEWRAQSYTNGKALALAYITGRAVMNRLDEVVGPQNWMDEYEQIEGGERGFLCKLSIRVGDEWITKSDGADESDIESIKGGISDALKRAAVKWGVGRYLYNLPAVWVKAEKKDGSKFIKLLETPKLPAWAKPEGSKDKDDNEMQQPPLPERFSKEEVEAALKVVVPANIPLAGQTLGDAIKDAGMGLHVIKFLAGKVKSSAGMFDASTETAKAIQKAAIIVLSEIEG